MTDLARLSRAQVQIENAERIVRETRRRADTAARLRGEGKITKSCHRDAERMHREAVARLAALKS